MNPFTPGLRELVRIARRQCDRLRLSSAQSKLAKEETELGLLGWQQADFDGPVQEQVRQITDHERTQSRMANEAAALGIAMRQLQQQREAARKEFEAARTQLDEERRKIAEPLEEMEQQLAAKRKAVSNFEEATPQLDRELREVTELYTKLIQTERHTPQMHADLIRLRERSIAIPNEKADLKTQHIRTLNDIRALETSIEQKHPAVAALDARLRQLRTGFAASDGALEKEIAAREREKQKIEKQKDALEKAKTNPYRQIGAVLADSNIAPMNQPGALEAVLRRRFVIQGIELKIAESQHASRGEDRAALMKSWALCAVILALALAALVWLSAR